MSDSMPPGASSVVVGDQRALAGGIDLPVPPDGGRHRQQALGDAREDAGGGAPAMFFEGELALEGVVDALDPLPDGSQRPESRLLALAVGPHHPGPEHGGEILQKDAREALVAEDDLSRLDAGAIPQGLSNLALTQLGAGQAPGDGHPVGSAEQVELEAPEVPGVAAAVPVVGETAQSRALDGLTAGGAGNRSGVEEAQQVAPGGGDEGQLAHDPVEHRSAGPQALVVASLLRQVGEQMAQPVAGDAQPQALGWAAEQDLGHRQAGHLRVRQLRPVTRTTTGGPAEQVVDDDVEGDSEGVEVGIHKPYLGALCLLVTACPLLVAMESLISRRGKRERSWRRARLRSWRRSLCC